MKKVLSVILAVALIFSVMCVNVFAASEPLVGNNADDTTTNNGTYTDGAESFDDKKSENDITINFEETYEDENGDEITEDIRKHRYALDIEYQDLVIDLGEVIKTTTGDGTTVEYTYVWNVDTYKYDLVVQTTDGNGETTETTTLEGIALDGEYEVSANTFKITNHSDLIIYYKAEIAEANVTNLIDLYFGAGTTDMTDGVISSSVAAVKANADAPNYSSETVVLNAKPVDSATFGWIDVINALSENGVMQGGTVGTLTVTVSMNAFTTTPGTESTT